MAKPFIHVLKFPGMGEIASVVMDQQDFEAACDSLIDVMDPREGERANLETIEAIKKAKHLPMVARGTKTEHLFTQLGVEQDRMCLCVRGFSKMVANLLGPRFDPESN